jgi:hypothetical protein
MRGDVCWLSEWVFDDVRAMVGVAVYARFTYRQLAG